MYEIFNNNAELLKIIEITIQNNFSTIQQSDHINELVDNINNTVMMNKCDKFLYLLASKITNKDEIIKKICNKFIYRIVYTGICYENEVENFNMIRLFFNKKELYQYNVIMDDYIKSVAYTSNYIENIENKKLIIASLTSWYINHMTGSMNYNKAEEYGMFSSMLISIMKHHNVFEQNQKNLIFYPHLGYLNITLALEKNCHIILTPAQMLCLELFTQGTKGSSIYSYKYVFDSLKKNLSNYSDRFINNIIQSFIHSNIIVCIDNNILLCLNMKFSDDVNLIKIFHKINNTAQEIMENTMIELAHERNDILMCNINHIVKTQQYNRSELYSMCKEMIKLFDVTEDLFNKAIDMMIAKKYIQDDMKKIMWI